jgi:hypothetical protein
MVTREEIVSRTCVEYTVNEEGNRICMEWREQTETVTRPVTESARILIVASGPTGNP